MAGLLQSNDSKEQWSVGENEEEPQRIDLITPDKKQNGEIEDCFG